jgi:D-sedoheptulose 7-phosphate isomerase
MRAYIERFLDETKRVIESLDHEALENMTQAVVDIKERGGRLFIIGVGGSAANASHAVNDFRKLLELETYTPTDNVSELTARINDEGWEGCFSEWLRVSKMNSRDGLLVFSVGGGNESTSYNIVKAIDYAKTVEGTVLGVVSRDGGHTYRRADVCILIPPQSDDTITPLAESFQAFVWHMVVNAARLAPVGI